MAGRRTTLVISLALLLFAGVLLDGCRAATAEHSAPATAPSTSETTSPMIPLTTPTIGASSSMVLSPTTVPSAAATPSDEPTTPSVVAGDSTASPPAERPPVRIAFIRRGNAPSGDVYLLDALTGQQTRLTEDGLNLRPQWIAGGSGLLFQKARGDTASETWRWQPQTGVVKVQTGLWSPDGSTVAFTEPIAGVVSGTGIWIEKAGQRWQLTPMVPGINWRPLAWSPDGQRLAVARLEPAAGAEEDKGVRLPITGATLWVTDDGAPAGQLRQIAMPSLRGGAGVPEIALWSPDGRFLTVGVAPAISCVSCRVDGLLYFAVPADGGPPVELDSVRIEVGAISWAPDASFVVLSATGWRQIYDNKQVVRFDPITGARLDLSGNLDWADIQPSVSPDGAWIAFTRGRALRQLTGEVDPASLTPRDAIASRRIWLTRPDGTELHQLVDAPGWTDESPTWTTDGRWIVFVRWRLPRDGVAPTFELWASRPDGSDAQRLIGDLGPPNGIGPDLTVGYHSGFDWREILAVAPR